MLRIAAVSLLGLVVVIWILVSWTVNRQGLDADDLEDLEGVVVEVDDHGIPTITAGDWLALVEAQGHVVASQRLFQMDLMRRAAAGRLAELFGAAAVEHDRRRHLEDWQGAARRGAELLPEGERELCDRYAAGVNRFIEDNSGRWSLEYVLLRTDPEPWSCADTILVALNMAEQLSTGAGREALESVWRGAMDEEWADFLFPKDHPWNEPLFGENPKRLALPTSPLPKTAIGDVLAVARPVAAADSPAAGSNSWAWRGPSGSYLANDPHLAANVPHLWYVLRLRISPDEWVVGICIPGLPGVVIGINPHIAWAFTNVGEDVDDYVEETLSSDGSKYLARIEDGREVWQPVEERQSAIKVRGGSDVAVVGRHTHRGPLSSREHLGDAEYSRQWLPLRQDSDLARLWTVQLNRARSWEEANAALDAFRFPAQNALIMERGGGLGYRATGSGIQRQTSGRLPRPAAQGEWLGLEPPSERQRKWIPAGDDVASLATANQRIWVDEYGHDFAGDRRAARIRELLASSSELTHADMESFQLDTKSRYHGIILRWVADHGTPDGDRQEEMVARWRAWDDVAFANGETFSEALAVEKALRELLLLQVRKHLLPAKLQEIPYRALRKDAWILATLEADAGLERFGLDAQEVANHLIGVGQSAPPRYIAENRWRAQHPFVGRVPLIGRSFRVTEYAQWGHSSLVRVEGPHFGASARLVWVLSDPAQSTWITPVGQSGHVGSEHYDDLQALFYGDERLKVFDTGHDWGFADPDAADAVD
jgi:penicillin amidase